MKNETREIFNAILADWHIWATGFKPVSGHGKSAMFTDVRSSRQWDDVEDVIDGTLHNEQMKAVDFNVNELPALYRTAIQISARNIALGHSVWSSARLPQDQQERAELVADARAALLERLRDAGIV
jgi:hypothetical protein